MRGSSGNTNTNTNTNTQIQIHNNEELATFPQERIEQPTRNSQTRREKVGEPMARKATEVKKKKAKNMHCFLSMGKYDFE